MEWYEVTVRQDSKHQVWAASKEDAERDAVNEARYNVDESVSAHAVKTVRTSVNRNEIDDIATIKGRLESLVMEGVEENDDDHARQAYINTLTSIQDELGALIKSFVNNS